MGLMKSNKKAKKQVKNTLSFSVTINRIILGTEDM